MVLWFPYQSENMFIGSNLWREPFGSGTQQQEGMIFPQWFRRVTNEQLSFARTKPQLQLKPEHFHCHTAIFLPGHLPSIFSILSISVSKAMNYAKLAQNGTLLWSPLFAGQFFFQLESWMWMWLHAIKQQQQQQHNKSHWSFAHERTIGHWP